MKVETRITVPESHRLAEGNWRQNLEVTGRSLQDAMELFGDVIHDVSRTGRRNVGKMLSTLLPISLALSALTAACAGADQQSAIPEPTLGDRGPTPTLVSPTEISPTLPASEVPPTSTLSVSPTEIALPPTPEPTATQVSAENLARKNGFYIEGRAYSVVEENGAKYVVDGYNQAKMLRYEDGVWVDSTLEEKYGHLAPKEAKYKVTRFETANGGGGYRFDVYWTGNYYQESLHFDEINQDIPVIRVLYVTRDVNTGKLVEVEDVFGRDMAQVGVGGAFKITATHEVSQPWGNGFAEISPPRSLRIFEVFKKHGLELVGKRAVISVFDYKGYMDGLISRMKGQYPNCNIKDPVSLGACERRFYFELIDKGMVDFGEHVNEKLTGAGNGKVELYDKEVRFQIPMSQSEVDALKQDLNALAAELKNK